MTTRDAKLKRLENDPRNRTNKMYSYLRRRIATQCKHLNLESAFPLQRFTSLGEVSVREYTSDKTSFTALPPPRLYVFPFRLFLFSAAGDGEERIGSKSKEITWHNSRREWLLSIRDCISQILIRQLSLARSFVLDGKSERGT